MKKFCFCFLLVCGITCAFAQENIKAKHAVSSFESALDLFTKEKYVVAKHEFELYLKSGKEFKKIDAQYYIAYCVLEIGDEEQAEQLFNAFLVNYPHHHKSDLVHHDLARHYFSKGDYEKALQHYEQVNFAKLEHNEQMIAYFNQAYSYFINKEYVKAESLFDKVKKYDNQYTYAANYYSGFIKYKNGNYAQAINDFLVAEQNESYKPVVPFMLVNIYYQQGNYDQVIEYGAMVLGSKIPIQKKEDIVLLVADAHYFKKEYQEAEKLFTVLFNAKPLSDRAVIYRYAYSLWQVGEEDNAVSRFASVASDKDSVGQYSAYYLGTIYLKQDKKDFARNAFEQAGKADFDKEIQELSRFNTAKLHYESKYFDKTILLLIQFKETYPKSGLLREADELLMESYLQTQNYQKALDYIENLPVKTLRINKVYQQVAYLKAVDFYNQRNYGQAIAYFDKCLQFNYDMKVYNDALYWKAESLSILYQWQDAAKVYTLLVATNAKGTSLHSGSLYGKAYTYYNQKKYAEAFADFSAYISSTKPTEQHYSDALLRLADCYYFDKKWSSAVDFYQKAISGKVKNQDYAYMKLGESQSRSQNIEGAFRSYDVVIEKYSSSVYWSQTVYQKAMLAFQNGKYELAVKEINRFIQAKPKDENLPKLKLNKGIALLNIQSYQEALKEFDEILAEHCLDKSLSDEAFLLARETLSKLKREAEISQRLDMLMQCRPDSSMLVAYKYDVALGLYNERKFDIAIRYFEDFEQKYPDNEYKVDLHYYMANCYFQLGNSKKAIDYYVKEVNYGHNNHYQLSLLRLTKLLEDYDNQDEVIKYNKLLLKYASEDKQLLKAYESLMGAYYAEEKYDTSSYYATQILGHNNVIAYLKNKALLVKGKSMYRLEDSTSAQVFEELMKASSDEFGAEANYYLAKIARETKDNESAWNLLMNLKDQYSSYEYWVGKAFLMIAEIYADQGEQFQAESTLQSLIDYFPLPEIVDEARLLKSKLEEEKDTELKEEIEY